MSDYVKRLAGPYTGAGQTTFTFGFFTYQAKDIYVGTAMSNDEAATILEQDVDYTVTLNDDQEAVPGGSITLLTPGGLKEGETLVIGSCLEYVKNIDLTNYSRFPPEQIDTEFNRIVIMIQQIVEETGRTLKVPATSSETPDDMIERLLAAQSQAQSSADAAANSAQAAADSATEAAEIKEDVAEYAEAAGVLEPYASELVTIVTNINSVISVAEGLEEIPGYLETMQGYVADALDASTNAEAQVTIAKNWATKTDGPVENGEYSAKYWAQQSADIYDEIESLAENATSGITSAQSSAIAAVQAEGTTQKNSIQTYTQSQVSLITSATNNGLTEIDGHVDLAYQWSEKMDGPVADGKYSAKYWAQQASQGQVQANWAETNSSSISYIQNKPDLSVYLEATEAEETYQPKGSYAAAEHEHTTDEITDLDNFKPDTAGTADKLATARTISMSGAVTAQAQSFDGSANITFNVTALDGTKVTGTVPEATKASKDASGNNIEETYAPLNSPGLTGTPTAPTAAKGTSTTQIATTAFVQEAMGDVQDDTAASILQAFQDFADEHGITVPDTTNTESK